MTTKQRAVKFLQLAIQYVECDSPQTAQRAIRVATEHVDTLLGLEIIKLRQKANGKGKQQQPSKAL